MADHPVKVPVELRAQWRQDAPRYRDGGVGREDWLMDRAAQWGADQELEACCVVIKNLEGFVYPSIRIAELRAARRPKPPTLAEQALAELESLKGDANSMGMGFGAPFITTALNRLAELEAQADG